MYTATICRSAFADLTITGDLTPEIATNPAPTGQVGISHTDNCFTRAYMELDGPGDAVALRTNYCVYKSVGSSHISPYAAHSLSTDCPHTLRNFPFSDDPAVLSYHACLYHRMGHFGIQRRPLSMPVRDVIPGLRDILLLTAQAYSGVLVA
jgi:hypothetical protein